MPIESGGSVLQKANKKKRIKNKNPINETKNNAFERKNDNI